MRKLLTAALPALLLAGLWASGASAGDKVTICHAAGLDGTTHYVTLTISENAVYGPAGHFHENGTPQAGHEQDYFGPCQGNESPSPTPTETPPPSPPPCTEDMDCWDCETMGNQECGTWEPSWSADPDGQTMTTYLPPKNLAETGPAEDLVLVVIGTAGLLGCGLAALYAARRKSL